MKHRRLTSIIIALALLPVACAQTPAPTRPDAFPIRDDQTVVFFGDSITQSGAYVEYFDAFLRTRFPDRRIRVINRGISSETISGTSEPDHDPRRPDAHKRFTRDITPLNPDFVVACFGMNDGNYHPFNDPLFEKYKAGVRRLIARVANESGGQLIFLTPPPFDPYRVKASDPNAAHYGYKFPALNYDQTLARYAQYLLTLRGRGFIVADVHTAANQHLAKRREQKVSFHLAPDAVHPNPTGHWLMTQTLLETLDAPSDVDAVHVDAANQKLLLGAAKDLATNMTSVSFTWAPRLPMPLDPRWDRASIEIEHLSERLNRHLLTVTGLPASSSYQLLADGKLITTLTAAQLAEGVDLTQLESFPTTARAAELLSLVQQRHRLLYNAWRESLKQDGSIPPDVLARADQLDRHARDLATPKPIHIQIKPHTTTSTR